MTIQEINNIISDVKEKSGLQNIQFTLNYSMFGNYVVFWLFQNEKHELYTTTVEDLFETENGGVISLEWLKNTLMGYANKLVSHDTSNNVSEVGWAQCNQCGWGTDVYKYEHGDTYTSGNSCPDCGVGIYKIDWDFYN